jgi:hypothetical protein
MKSTSSAFAIRGSGLKVSSILNSIERKFSE